MIDINPKTTNTVHVVEQKTKNANEGYEHNLYKSLASFLLPLSRIICRKKSIAFQSTSFVLYGKIKVVL